MPSPCFNPSGFLQCFSSKSAHEKRCFEAVFFSSRMQGVNDLHLFSHSELCRRIGFQERYAFTLAMSRASFAVTLVFCPS
jgi:hypothetical protein